MALRPIDIVVRSLGTSKAASDLKSLAAAARAATAATTTQAKAQTAASQAATKALAAQKRAGADWARQIEAEARKAGTAVDRFGRSIGDGKAWAAQKKAAADWARQIDAEAKKAGSAVDRFGRSIGDGKAWAAQKRAGADWARQIEMEARRAGTAVDRFGRSLNRNQAWAQQKRDAAAWARQIEAEARRAGTAVDRFGQKLGTGNNAAWEAQKRAAADWARQIEMEARRAGTAVDRFGERIGQAKWRGLTKEELTDRRNIGLATTAIGVGGEAALFNAAQAAGQMQMWEIAFGKMMGSADAGRAKIKELSDVAATTSFSMPGLVQQAQQLRAMGFAANELIPTITTLGDAIAASGKGEDVLERVVFNLAQIRNMPNPNLVDLKQFAYAGMNLKEIMQASTGRSMEYSDMQAMSGEEFYKSFMEGLEKLFGGMNVELAKTLPGSLNNLSDAMFRFRVAIGGPVAPTITMIADGISAVANSFEGWPGWLKTLVSWGAALGFGFVALAGTIITTTAQIGLCKIGLDALNGGSGLKGLASGVFKLIPGIGGLTGGLGSLTSGAGTALSALGSLSGFLSVALPLAVAAGVALMIKRAMEAQMELDEKRRADVESGDESKMAPRNTREGAQQRIADKERQIAELDKKIAGAEERARASRGNVKIFGFGDTSADFEKEAAGHEARRRGLLADIRRLRQRAASLPSASAASAPVAAPTTAGLPVVTAVAGMQLTAGAPGSTPTGAAGNVAALQSQIESLEDQYRATKDKALKKELSDQLFYARRRLRHAKADAAAAKRQGAAQARVSAVLAGRQGAGAGTDVDALRDQLAVTTDPNQKARLREAIRVSSRAQKDAKQESRLLDQRRAAFADVALEQLKTDTETAIASLEAQKSRSGRSKRDKAIDYQIARLQAAQEIEAARLNAATMEPFKAQAAQRIAAIRAAGIMAKAQIGGAFAGRIPGLVGGVPGGARGGSAPASAVPAAPALTKWMNLGNGYDGSFGFAGGVIGASNGAGGTRGGAAARERSMNVRANPPIISRAEDGRWRVRVTIPDFFIGDALGRSLRNAGAMG